MAARGSRTSLRLSVEAQAFFSLLAISGQTAHETAILLVQHRFDLSKAALAVGLAEGCKDCAKGANGEGLRGCLKHLCRMRQRAKRAVDRMRALVPGMHVPLRRRPVVHFGADRRVADESTLYERTSTSDDGGRSDTADPAEAAELAEESAR